MSCLLLALALLAATPAGAAEDPFWMRDWTFGAVSGPPGPRALLARTGVRHLALRREGLTDPLGESCAAEVGYDDIRPRDRGAIARHFGPHWRFPAVLDTPGTVAGWVRCGDVNAVAVAFMRPGLGYRFFEDGLVIALR
ncbi:hypothetical protein [Roseomonas populi]|uniref:Uncharacterized protein n=1 Tax=Roseomonas populi TaxID=3121582 RepID=A0ABT1XAC8_9PROT|nr:hypothetical protein [Roseomonas pecuniae]MCR0985071.1 hypothetical protein [Roseomonas pecuniae]